MALNDSIFPADEWYEHRGNIYWIVRFGKTPVGFAVGTNIGHRIFYLSRAGILESHRGNGLHKRLIKVRERFARSHNFKYIITYTIKNNPESFCHLIKTGYEIYEPEHEWADDVFYFRKLL